MGKGTLRISSYFNVADVGKSTSLLYNGLTSRIDLVPSDLTRQLREAGGRSDFSFLSPDEVRHLTNRGHLTELSVSREREEFRKLAEGVVEASEELNEKAGGGRAVAFILTYKCNLSCTYCYQHEIRKDESLPSMDEAFVEEFFRRYLKKLFPRCHKKNINFQLFGGEPLLPANRAVIERILKYAKKYGSPVSTATNAAALPQMLDLVGPDAGKIQSLQVTLDGAPSFHDRTRVPRSGAPTFEGMIRSIHALIGAKARVTIRIHLHPDGLEPTRALVRHLDREGILGHEGVYAYFAPINSFDGSDVSVTYFEPFSEIFQYVAMRQKAPPSTFARGLSGIMDATVMRTVLRSRYCAAGAGLLRVVDPRGDIYDCFEEAGNKARRIGALSDGEIRYFKLNGSYRRRHILNMPECLKCSIALYCGGGCPNQARLRNGSLFKPFCQLSREFVGETLKAYFLLKQAGGTGPAPEPVC
jgi:uncharacterized protein